LITFIDLFSGIGGFRIAFESVGAKCIFSADNDKYACQTYLMNFNEFPYRDVTKLEPEEIPDFNILCAGFPCQPFSIAGYRKGFADTRGTLFFDIERILENKKPEAFILENVKGLINHDGGRTFKTILSSLEKKLNYKVFYKVLNSKDYGVPQNRERIYIIGFKNHKTEFHFPKKFHKPVTLKDIIIKDIDSNDPEVRISETAKFNILNNLKRHKKYSVIKDYEYLIAYEIRKSRTSFRFDGLSPTLTAKMGTGGNNVPVLVQQMKKLSVRECLRIQGFPDSFKILPNKAQSYKQIGNSITVPMVKELAKEIVKHLT
jgi:DNA (cytosine-5)-methyltransferase 1